MSRKQITCGHGRLIRDGVGVDLEPSCGCRMPTTLDATAEVAKCQVCGGADKVDDDGMCSLCGYYDGRGLKRLDLLRKRVASLAAEVERLQGICVQWQDDLEATRRSHAKLCQFIKTTLRLDNWPTFEGEFVNGAGSLLLTEVERLRAENERLWKKIESEG